MRVKLILGGLLFVIVAAVGACSAPRLASHIENAGPTKPDTVAAGTTLPLNAFVADQDREGMDGVEVLWAVRSGTGTISATTTTTGGGGMTSVNFTAPAGAGLTTMVTAGVTTLGASVTYTIVTK